MNPSTLSEKHTLVEFFNEQELDPNVDIVIAPPALWLIPLKEKIRKDIKVAAQNCYYKMAGAFTGEISPTQLHDAGVEWVILGHSERRTLFGETSQFVAQKVVAALDCDLDVIICVGETLQEREAGKTMDVVKEQLDPIIKLLKEEKHESEWANAVIAYEPVWAIGTGKVATPAQAQEVHEQIRAFLKETVSANVAENIRIIYGGSVNQKNAKELGTLPDVDGFLVGGASLKPEFVEILNVHKK